MPEKLWRWPNFSPEQIACRGDGTIPIRIDEAALDRLQALPEGAAIVEMLSDYAVMRD